MTDRYRQIAADYLQALDDKKSVLVVSPTHAEAGSITAAIRSELRAGREARGGGPRVYPAGAGRSPARRNAGRRPPTGRAT